MGVRLAGTIASSVTAHMCKGKQDLLSFTHCCLGHSYSLFHSAFGKQIKAAQNPNNS